MSLFGGIELPGHPCLDNCRRLDLLPIPMIRRAHRVGMAIDREHFHQLTSEFNVEMDELRKDITSYIPAERLETFSERMVDDASEEDEGDEHANANVNTSSFNVNSPEQVGELLFETLGIGTEKKLKRTKTGERISADKKNLELIKMEHAVVPLIIRYGELKTLVKTYTVKLPRVAVFHPRSSSSAVLCPICELHHWAESWRIHGEMGTTRAATGRINHKNPNLGNIPARTKDGQRVQAGFVAAQGYRLVIRDLSQIECRDLAHLANCLSMIAVYEADGDLHWDTCYKTGLIPLNETADKVIHLGQRMAAKRCIAEGQHVLTDKGLTPIEKVRKHDRVWDGVEFVTHEGVVKQGIQDTIHYDGLTATTDHEVWTGGGSKSTLFEASCFAQRLLRAGDGIKPLEFNPNNWPYSSVRSAIDGGRVMTYDIVNAGPRHRYVVENKLVANCNFGIANGSTEKGLFMQLVMDFGANKSLVPDWLTEAWCKQFIVQWLDSRFEVRAFFETCWQRARRYQLTWEPFGRVRPIPEIRSYHRWIQEAGMRYAQNFPITSLAAGQLKIAMGKAHWMYDLLRAQNIRAELLLSIHDSIMGEVEEDAVDDGMDAVEWAMDTCMTDERTGEHMFRVPIKSDGMIAERWVK